MLLGTLLIMSDEEVSAVQKSSADFIIVLNQASFDKYVSWVKKGGSIIVNSSLAMIKKTREDINYIFVPITKLAQEKLGNIKMSNILALGTLSKVTKLISLDTLEKALQNVIPARKANLIPKNIEALKLGYEYDLLKV